MMDCDGSTLDFDEDAETRMMNVCVCVFILHYFLDGRTGTVILTRVIVILLDTSLYSVFYPSIQIVR